MGTIVIVSFISNESTPSRNTKRPQSVVVGREMYDSQSARGTIYHTHRPRAVDIFFVNLWREFVLGRKPC